MIVELDRDPQLYADGNIVEVSIFFYYNLHNNYTVGFFKWPRAPGAHNPAMDGFTVRRTGDVPTKIRVLMYLEHFPEQYKVRPELGKVLSSGGLLF